jgi:hypothetical protein
MNRSYRYYYAKTSLSNLSRLRYREKYIYQISKVIKLECFDNRVVVC